MAALRDVDTDLLEVWTFALDDFSIVDIQPVNTAYGDVDTNQFDTNVMVMPVLLSALGIDAADASHRITYVVGVDGYYEAPNDSVVDFAGPMTFDPLKPGLWAEGSDGSDLVYLARPGRSLKIHKDAASLAADGSNSLLVLHFHNRSGDKVEVVRIRN